jgi:hypothetical protein
MLVGHFNDNFKHLGPVYMEESYPARRVTRPGETNKPSVYMYASLFIWNRVTHVKTHKFLQVCKQVVTNLFTSYRQVVFALLVPSCCNKFGKSC